MVLWAVVADDVVDAVVVVEATFCGLLLLLLRAQEEVHGDVDDYEDYFGRQGGCRHPFWLGCGALPLFYFLFDFCFGEKLG